MTTQTSPSRRTWIGTEAEQLADVLHTLADHLRAHPHLHQVVAAPLAFTFVPPAAEVVKLQQLSGPQDLVALRGLIAWAASLGVVDAHVQLIASSVYVHVRGRIATADGATEVDVEVWDCEPALIGADLGEGPVELAELLRVAEAQVVEREALEKVGAGR